jgi:methylenetetrahydrofolate reductase (NADH)
VDKQLIRNFVSDFSIETTVREAQRIDRYGDVVKSGTRLYIAHVPGNTPQETVALARRLRHEGMEPVPHIVARRIATVSALDDLLGRLTGEADVTRVLVVAGDIATPVGALDSSLQILDSGLLEKHGIRRVDLAGHPEGHKDIPEAVLRDAVVKKNAYSSSAGVDVHFITQFVFTADPVVTWEMSNRAINRLPFIAGIPGLATMKTLLKFALDCGVGPSLHALSRHAANLTKLLTIATPDELLVGLARHKEQNPGTLLSGVHFFPFGGLKRTAEWLRKITEGSFELTDSGSGLKVA